MRNFVSLRYVHDNVPSIWKYMTEHTCILKKFGTTIYEGVLDEGKYLKYLSDDDSPSITVECYVNPDSTVLLTVENNDYIEKVKSLSSRASSFSSAEAKVEDIIGNPKLYCEAINLITMIPMVEGKSWKDKIKYVLEEGEEEEGQGMDDAAASEENPDEDSENKDSEDSEDSKDSAALGQDGAKEDADAKQRSEIQFKIFTAPDKQVTDLKEGEKYLKIEYVYRDKKAGIEIDFLIGKKKEDGNWQLYIGKPGSASYDDDPYKSLETKELSKAINTAVDKVIDLIKEVKKDKDNWVQFYTYK